MAVFGFVFGMRPFAHAAYDTGHDNPSRWSRSCRKRNLTGFSVALHARVAFGET